jgi:hypothetical protein
LVVQYARRILPCKGKAFSGRENMFDVFISHVQHLSISENILCPYGAICIRLFFSTNPLPRWGNCQSAIKCEPISDLRDCICIASSTFYPKTPLSLWGNLHQALFFYQPIAPMGQLRATSEAKRHVSVLDCPLLYRIAQLNQLAQWGKCGQSEANEHGNVIDCPMPYRIVQLNQLPHRGKGLVAAR